VSGAPSPAPAGDSIAATTLPEAGKVVGWGLAFWGVGQLAVAVFSHNATALVAVQAALAEWGAGRIGIAWSDPTAEMPTWRQIGRRAGTGAALGAGAAGIAVGIALATRAAAWAAPHPAVSMLAVSFVVAALSAVRDELLLRGVVLRATRGLLPGWAALASCGAAAAAARWGLEGAVSLALAVEALRGVALAGVWVRDRGAWMAVAANTAWTWGLGGLVHGGLVDLRVAGVAGADAGVPALAAAAVAAAAACVWAART
jgi:hypothetical protein